MDNQDALTQIGQQHHDADGDDHDAACQMQHCRDGLHPMVVPCPKTSQPPRDDAGSRNSQVERSGPKAHRDHGKASNRKSIETGRDHQNKQCASARSYRDAGDQSDRIACCRQRCHVVDTWTMRVATTAVCDLLELVDFVPTSYATKYQNSPDRGNGHVARWGKPSLCEVSEISRPYL